MTAETKTVTIYTANDGKQFINDDLACLKHEAKFYIDPAIFNMATFIGWDGIKVDFKTILENSIYILYDKEKLTPCQPLATFAHYIIIHDVKAFKKWNNLLELYEEEGDGFFEIEIDPTQGTFWECENNLEQNWICHDDFMNKLIEYQIIKRI